MSSGPTSIFVDACRRRPVERTPVWFMRQAGRSLPEYRAIRAKASMFEIVGDPELAAEVTLQPVRRLGVDAAILFSDIVVPLVGVGVDIALRDGVGPVVDQPFRTAADLARLRPLEPDADIAHVLDTVTLVAKECEVPLIGFAGAPFTLASYLVEGGPSKSHARTKALMYAEPAMWARLLESLADIVLGSLRAQVAAGAAAVQVFDSWAGALSPGDYRRYVLPASRRIFTGLADLDVPRIHFGVGTGELLGLFAEAGADVVGVDWRVPLDQARARLPADVAVQGNLDPAVCLAPPATMAAAVTDVLERNGGRPGHVFNLGHGVLPDTDPDNLRRVVDQVHAWSPA
ncbi:MAG TPA: uroporphyrinogen decarboxylase [Acidimicrobiales bacterium]|jgi:uroporphyrinogen decarboxylase|nr:uroporphyrinogen decarboxylase [Acidimicrobiales bacterium]